MSSPADLLASCASVDAGISKSANIPMDQALAATSAAASWSAVILSKPTCGVSAAEVATNGSIPVISFNWNSCGTVTLSARARCT